ncbi:MAG: nucleotidyltransferase family protein [Acidobacteriota bacterium]
MSAAPHIAERPVAAVLLAAGESRRLGRPKQLLEWRGEPLVRRAALMLLRTRARPIIVVLGHRGSDVARALRGLDVERVDNPRYAEGQSTSVTTGVRAVDGRSTGALFVPCDQPHLRARTVDALIHAAVSSPGAVLRPIYDGRPGAPVLFPAALFPELLGLEGDEGGRQILRRFQDKVVNIPVADAAEGFDVDTRDDVEALNAIPAPPPEDSP